MRAKFILKIKLFYIFLCQAQVCKYHSDMGRDSLSYFHKKIDFVFTFLNWEKQTWYWGEKVALFYLKIGPNFCKINLISPLSCTVKPN